MTPKAALGTLFLLGIAVIGFILIVAMLAGFRAGVQWLGRRLAPEPEQDADPDEQQWASVQAVTRQPCPWCIEDGDPGQGRPSWWNQDCTCTGDCGNDACLWYAGAEQGHPW